MKIIAGRTIVLMIHNDKLGVVTEKYLKKWTIAAGMDSWTLREKDFVPIFNLRKEADLGLYTPDKVIERHKTGIMNAMRKNNVRKKAVRLTKENLKLRIDVSSTRFAKKKS